MKTAFPIGVIVAAALPLAACTTEMDDEREILAPAINVVGEPESCIRTNQIRDTIVHDDYTIDFEMRNGPLYRNTLRQRCYSLGFDERFTYEVRAGSLCSGETITVLHSDGRPGASCALGDFIPVELVEEAAD